MKNYMIVPVIAGIKRDIADMFDQGNLSQEQSIQILRLIDKNLESFNADHAIDSEPRCGRCLRIMEDEDTFSLENEVNKITGGSWWSEELESEVFTDLVCSDCKNLLLKKYLKM